MASLGNCLNWESVALSGVHTVPSRNRRERGTFQSLTQFQISLQVTIVFDNLDHNDEHVFLHHWDLVSSRDQACFGTGMHTTTVTEDPTDPIHCVLLNGDISIIDRIYK